MAFTNRFALQALDSRYGLTTVKGVLCNEFEMFGIAAGSPWREPTSRALADW
jgi:hypothetical protein